MDFADGFALLGYALVVSGVALMHPPAAVIVAGALLFVGAYLLDARSSK